MKEKKALISGFVGRLIIIVASFAVILVLFARVGWTDVINKEACHQSVVMRSMPNVIGESMKRSIKLECETEKIVIDYQDDDKIKERIANAMYDCWWMLGEGELDFFVRPLGPAQTHCIICSKISFKDNVRNRYSKITDFPEYLKKTPLPTSQNKDETYAEWFGIEESFSDDDFENQAIDTGKDYAVIFSLIEKSRFASVGYGLSGCLMSAAIGTKVGIATAAVPVVGIYLAPITGVAAFVAGCGSIIWGAKKTDEWATGGNSYIASLNLVPYTKEFIEEGLDCTTIESIP